MQSFRTLISQIRPVEVVQDRDLVGSSVVKMLKNSHVCPTITSMAPSKIFSAHKTKALLSTKFFAGVPEENWPKVIRDLIREDEEADGDIADVAGSDLAI